MIPNPLGTQHKYSVRFDKSNFTMDGHESLIRKNHAELCRIIFNLRAKLKRVNKELIKAKSDAKYYHASRQEERKKKEEEKEKVGKILKILFESNHARKNNPESPIKNIFSQILPLYNSHSDSISWSSKKEVQKSEKNTFNLNLTSSSSTSSSLISSSSKNVNSSFEKVDSISSRSNLTSSSSNSIPPRSNSIPPRSGKKRNFKFKFKPNPKKIKTGFRKSRTSGISRVGSEIPRVSPGIFEVRPEFFTPEIKNTLQQDVTEPSEDLSSLFFSREERIMLLRYINTQMNEEDRQTALLKFCRMEMLRVKYHPHDS